jgi:predicted nucleotidyltransferase component of viral defense system
MSLPTPITRQQLQAINRRSRKYTLDTAEKDYYITLALALMVASPLLDILVFKGGTALHHCYLDHYRFSEDIDFSSREAGELTLAVVKAALEQEDLFQVRKEYVSGATIKIERLWYPGILDQPGAIKVEIDQLQNVVLPPQERVYHNDWDIPLRLAVMDIREICAEKIRAASQRSRYRDFYDLYLIFEQYNCDLADIVALIRQKEVRRPITSQALHANWRRAARDLQDGKDPVRYSRFIPDADIEQFLEQIHFAPILPEE